MDPTATWDALPAAIERGARAFLVGLGSELKQAVELTSGVSFRLGRSYRANVYLGHASVSREHATLTWRGGRTFVIEDQGSRNGTCVNQRPVQGAVEFEPGADLQVGEVRLTVLLRAPEAEEPEPRLVARSAAMTSLVDRCARASATGCTVLLLGETGVGKDLAARWIHAKSPRATGPFISLSGGTLDGPLAASRLFGHVAGAFTGACEPQVGAFEAASGGTLFLDEIGELPLRTQSLLLRVLEERRVTRLGATEGAAVDVRVIAATHRDLDEMVRQNRFRNDLLHRLDVLRIPIPPLRERPEDLDALIDHFLTSSARSVRLGAGARDRLRAHPWSGNVRELFNVLERSLVMLDPSRDRLEACDLVGLGDEPPAGSLSWPLPAQVAATERDAMRAALDACEGNQTHAAQRLGITRRALIYRMKKHGLSAR